MVLAPQLQQSLALLQAPVLELKALVEQELQQNPVLEEVEGAEVELPDKPAENLGETSDATAKLMPASTPMKRPVTPICQKAESAPADDFQEEFDKLVQLDQEWRDNFSQDQLARSATTTDDEEKRQFMFDSLTAGNVACANF